MTTALATSVHAPSTGPRQSDAGPHRAARAVCYLPSPTVVVIRVYGEIDACNAEILTEHVAEHATPCRGVVLDLAALDFFGNEGFSTLHRVAVSCARTGTGWALVPGAAVSRVLRICDPHCSLPVVGSVAAAMATSPPGALTRLQPRHAQPRH